MVRTFGTLQVGDTVIVDMNLTFRALVVEFNPEGTHAQIQFNPGSVDWYVLGRLTTTYRKPT